MTESDGYFSLLGLSPGNYTAVVDPEQLKRLNLSASPSEFPFTIEKSIEGDLVDEVEFVLTPVAK